jgi:hypothetical protein
MEIVSKLLHWIRKVLIWKNKPKRGAMIYSLRDSIGLFYLYDPVDGRWKSEIPSSRWSDHPLPDNIIVIEDSYGKDVRVRRIERTSDCVTIHLLDRR